MGTGATVALVALTALSAGSQIVSGIQTNSAMTDQGISYAKQAQLTQYESQLEAQQKQREVDKLAARQVMAMAKNGAMTNDGSPLAILHETATLGQQEVDAIRNKGIAMTDYYKSLSSQSFNSGRSSLLGGGIGALTTIGSSILGANMYGIGGGVSGTAGQATGWTPSINAASVPKSGYSGALPKL